MSVNEGRYGGDGYFSGARLLISDTRVALLLLREARNRACERLFGTSRDDAALVTMIGLATLAHFAHGKAHQAVTGPGGPYLSDTWIAGGVLSEGLHAIAGDSARDTPLLGPLIVGAVIAHSLRPVLRVSLHDLRVAGHQLRVDFDHRYGHLIRPNRRRPPARA